MKVIKPKELEKKQQLFNKNNCLNDDDDISQVFIEYHHTIKFKVILVAFNKSL